MSSLPRSKFIPAYFFISGFYEFLRVTTDHLGFGDLLGGAVFALAVWVIWSVRRHLIRMANDMSLRIGDVMLDHSTRPFRSWIRHAVPGKVETIVSFRVLGE